jgi:hypothetical protein
VNDINRRKTRVVLILIATHLAIVLIHGAAHTRLDIRTSPAQNVFISTMILMGPVLAGALLWFTKSALGPVVLLISMIGSFCFGFYYHFVLVSPDHVAHVARLTPRLWSVTFQLTSVLMAISEAASALAAVWIMKTWGRGRAALC